MIIVAVALPIVVVVTLWFTSWAENRLTDPAGTTPVRHVRQRARAR